MAGRLGILVNPIAGMGGRVGLHGTDTDELLVEAVRRGARPVTPLRMRRALTRLAARAGLSATAAPGALGGDDAAAIGLSPDVVKLSVGEPTTAADTIKAARLLKAAGADLILFAGGDGTAADVLDAVGEEMPILGVPSGVKMRSGVFAANPEAAGDLAAEFLAAPRRQCARGEVVDVPSPNAVTEDQVFAGVLRGIATVPLANDGRLTGPKVSNVLGSRASLDELCTAVARELQPGTLYLFGPGSTTGLVLKNIGLSHTTLGVDAVRDGELVGLDMSEAEIVEAIGESETTRLVLGVIGGQGVLLGRGNQQIGPRVLAMLSASDVLVLSTAEKLLALRPPRLIVDTGDEAPIQWFTSYQRVRVGPFRYLMMPVAAA